MGNWRSRTLFAAAIACVAGGTMLAQKGAGTAADSNSPHSTTSAADSKFAKDAAIGGLMEVELGKIAVQKASSDKVKTFGQKMMDDHSKADQDLKSLASKDNLTLPTALDAKHQAMVDKLSAMSGTQFDRAYMRDMVRDHQQDVAEFQKEADNGSNADLKSFAGAKLPTLQEHLKLAQETESSLSSRSSK